MWNKSALTLAIGLLGAQGALATDPPVFSQRHGYQDSTFTLTLSSETEGAKIYYTTDCTVPTPEKGILYKEPFPVARNATYRAVAIDSLGERSVLTAATYLFVDNVLNQKNNPYGYPSKWGPYSSIQGTATADYEMDPEMTRDPYMKEHIAKGLRSLPVMSVITEPGFLFSKEQNDSTGGIYIYTGGDASSTGNGYGNGWLRAASVEFMPLPDTYDKIDGFQVNCAIKIHGNASRQAEKTPKHSLRMKMKSEYGPGKLHYKLFGKGGGKKFNQVVIRAGFGNSWLHWLTSQQRQAMFTRDAWAKRMMKQMGHLSAGTRFAHLYLNGMYWGLYNPTERIDADFCELHLDGEPEEWDVVRHDDGKLNTVDGTLDDYNRLVDALENSGSHASYLKMLGIDKDGNEEEGSDVLFDPDNFIDFMLVNYYGGNGDWDHHNWVAVHRKGSREGFRWLPWDSELMLQGVNDNVLKVNNKHCPTAIFNSLMSHCTAFKMRFVDRAYRALVEPFGMLRPDSAQAVWEELVDEIDEAVWAESARWGDYRRDVHPYTSRGDLYTKEGHFDKQCAYMRNTYFPSRTDIVLKQIKDAGWWTNVANAPALSLDGEPMEVENATIGSGQEITLKGTGSVYYTTDGTDPIGYTASGGIKRNPSNVYSEPFTLTESCTVKARSYHLSKGWSPLCERRFTLEGIDGIQSAPHTVSDDRYYDLQGRPITHPGRGVYIHKGRKVVLK